MTGLPDEEARQRIACDLSHSLVVVAGAGTGKTASLVRRVVNLVRSGAPLGELAVITFTEAAAAELRLRLADALVAEAQKDPSDPVLGRAAAEVDEAAICTLHAFAQRMLLEHALAAGLPPGFDVLDDMAERSDFETRLAAFTDALFDDAEAEAMLLRGFVLGLNEGPMTDLAWCLHRHWDRLEDGGLARIEQHRPDASAHSGSDATAVLEALDRALVMAPWCTSDFDHLLVHLHDKLAPARDLLSGVAHDELAALPLLVRLPSFACGNGRSENWGERLYEVRAACTAAEATRQDLLSAARAPLIAELSYRLARFTVHSAAQRVADGRLTFHDLLVHCRRLLRQDDAARKALRQRWRWLLVDEFQDTDPLQVEVAARLASAVDGSADLAQVRPGALFVVGDPRQSIYRFRRADIDLFAGVCRDIGDEVVLESNFRSVPGIVRFVNTVFTHLFGPSAEPGQAAHHPLEAQRRALPTAVESGHVQLTLEGIGPPPAVVHPLVELQPVVVLGGPVPDATVAEVRRAGARQLAAALTTAVTEGWPVSDPDDPSALRPLRWRDIAVLIPTRNSLPSLEQAFEEDEVPFRLEGAALLWGSDEVRDVRCALAAADEPSDAVSVLAALRSAGLACGDDDLVTWHSGGGSWDPRSPVPAHLADHPVATAMAVLADLHRRRWWSDPSQMVETAMAELHSFELAFARRRPRQHWDRLLWLSDQARLFDDTMGGSLHDFLRWAELQAEGDGRSSRLGPPDADDDAVRVMTVHGAKGLEFPMVVVTGLERDESSGFRPDAVLWQADGSMEIGAGKELRSPGYEQAAAAERILDRQERIRLLYVAMTRARDHLVLCLHHKARNGNADSSQAAALESLCRQYPLLWRRMPGPAASPSVSVAPGSVSLAPRSVLASAAPSIGGGPVGEAPEPEGEAPEDAVRSWTEALEAFSRRRAESLARGRAVPVVTASALAHAPSAGPGLREPTTPPGPTPDDGFTGWRTASAPAGGGEIALDVGRAVHAVLSALDLSTGRDATGTDVASLSRQRADVFGVPDHAREVARMVEGALSSSAIRQAAARRHHKEVYLSMALGAEDSDGLFEGFADLLVEDTEGLVVIDYKTDGLQGAGALSEAARRYTPQLAAYALAAEAATGRPVRKATLLFLAADPPIEHVIEDSALSRAKDTARAAMGELAAVSLAR